MKKLLIITALALLLPAAGLCWTTSDAMRAVVAAKNWTGGGETPVEGQNYTDDFASDTWDDLSGTHQITSGEMGLQYNEAVSYPSDTDTVTQYVIVQLTSNSNQDSVGFVFRSTGTGSAGYYAVYQADANNWFWEHWDGGGYNADIDTDATLAIGLGDYVGATIQGTGSGTTVKIWDLGPSPCRNTPYDKDNWCSSSDAADATMTNTVGNYEDTGLRVGLCAYPSTGTDQNFMDNWYGGDTQ